MKKSFFLSFCTAVLALSLILSGCTKTTPAGPFELPENTVLDDFSDSDLSAAFGGATGTWAAFGDTALTGGASVVSAAGAAGQMLGVTATVTANLDSNTSQYTTLSAGRYGFVTAELPLSKNLDLLANNNALTFDLKGVNTGAAVTYKVFFYSENGNLCKMTTWTAIPTVIQNKTVDFADLTVPAGAAYTVNSVLQSVKKIVFAFMYYDGIGFSVAIELYIDNVETAFFPG